MPGARVSAELSTLTERKGAAVYVAIGPNALQTLLDSDVGAPILSLWTSTESFRRITAAPRPDKRRGAVTAIFAEAAPLHQFKLIRSLYRRHVAVAALLSPGVAFLQPQLEQAARGNDLELEVVTVDPGENVLRAFTALRDVKVLFMQPDRDLYTPESVRYVLESAYRRGQSVIGFSPSLVRAGTLAAAYSTIDDVLDQVPMITDDLALGRLPAPQYPLYWRVQINERVAQSLNILVDDSLRALGNLQVRQ